VATKLKELKLDDDHATAILEKAIEYESYTEDMPASKRDRIKAATDQVALMIDAWVDDEVTPDSDEPDIAEMGTIIEGIFEIAGVVIDEDGEVEYVEPGDVDGTEPAGDDDEAAVDINDTIDGYDELSASSKVKAIKALELDMDDDDDYNTAVGIYEYEESQEKPSSRVLSYLDDVIPAEGEAAVDEPDDDEGAEAAGGEGGWEEPWAKYDKQTAVEVKKELDKLLAKEELTVEMAQYVIDYEEGREKPPARKRIIDHAAKLMEELEGGGEAEEEPEPAPKRSARPSRASRTRTTSSTRRRGTATSSKEPDEEPEPVTNNGAGVFVISGGDEDITAYGIYGAMGAVADLLAAGYEEVSVAAG
jgi:hypothetical protein